VIRAVVIVLALCLLVPATAGTSSTAPPPMALTASPARVTLHGSGQATIQVRNTGRSAIVIDARRAGFALDLRGRPKIVTHGGVRTAEGWLTLRPRRMGLAPGGSGSLVVAARLPRNAEPGDHDALVLVTTRRRPVGGVAVRMRIGVVVLVRAPGKIVRKLELRALRIRKGRRARVLELLVANRGNLTETLLRGRVTLTLMRRGVVLATLRAPSRDVRPRTHGVVQFAYGGPLRGSVTARARISLVHSNQVVQTSFRIRL
jgi:hypothetical protein